MHNTDESAIRPRFKLISPHSAESIEAAFIKAQHNSNSICEAQIRRNYINLSPKFDTHYWSPQLTISLDEAEEGTVVRGMYGPRPNVWTLFVFFYLLIGLAAMIVGTWGLSLYWLQKPSHILWMLPVLCIIFLSLYLVAYYGKKLGHDQMRLLQSFFEKTLSEVDE